MYTHLQCARYCCRMRSILSQPRAPRTNQVSLPKSLCISGMSGELGVMGNGLGYAPLHSLWTIKLRSAGTRCPKTSQSGATRRSAQGQSLSEVDTLKHPGRRALRAPGAGRRCAPRVGAGLRGRVQTGELEGRPFCGLRWRSTAAYAQAPQGLHSGALTLSDLNGCVSCPGSG